jgi:hypothetical protein
MIQQIFSKRGQNTFSRIKVSPSNKCKSQVGFFDVVSRKWSHHTFTEGSDKDPWIISNLPYESQVVAKLLKQSPSREN